MYVIVLRLLQVFILQRQERINHPDASHAESLSYSLTLNKAIYDCLYPSVNCACDYVTDLVAPILPYIRSLNPGTSSFAYFDAASNVEVLQQLVQDITDGKDVSPHYLRRIRLVFDVFDETGKENIMSATLQALLKIKEHFVQTLQIVKKSVFNVICQLYGILGKGTITISQCDDLLQIHNPLIEILNRQCPFLSNIRVIVLIQVVSDS